MAVEEMNEQEIKDLQKIIDLGIENKRLKQENEKLREFAKDCSVSHIESRYKYRAQVILSEVKQDRL